MPRYRRKKSALRCRFDYDRFEMYVKAAGGMQSVCDRANVSRGSYYYIRRNQKLPLSRPIRKILEHLNLPTYKIHELFTKNTK